MITTKIALIGYKGKTGNKVYQELLDNNYEVIAIDKDGVLLSHVIQEVDLAIDFTNKHAALKHIFICLDNLKPFIVGTTWFSYDELAVIKSKCNL